MRSKLMLLTIALLVASAVVGACSGSDSERALGGSGTASVQRASDELAPEPLGAPMAEGMVVASDAESAAGGGFTGGGAALPEVGPKVIKTARLAIEVGDGEFRDALRAAIAVAEDHGGYVLTTSVEDRDRGFGSIELRVPAVSFGRALNELHELGELESESVEGRDVSQEYVDLAARLRNFQAQERVLLRLMDESRSVADTLRVQSQLQQVQLEIERLKGRINFIDDQTEMSTIRVSISEKGAKPAQIGVLGKAWRRAVEMSLAVVSAVIVGAGFVVPVALLVAVGAFVFVRLRPRLAP